ncbi:Scr1 family TA system antitoxin-like transcriptional regulator [Kitasatospora sp. NPDC091276]
MRTVVGGPKVMRRQMQHLLDVSRLPNVPRRLLAQLW